MIRSHVSPAIFSALVQNSLAVDAESGYCHCLSPAISRSPVRTIGLWPSWLQYSLTFPEMRWLDTRFFSCKHILQTPRGIGFPHSLLRHDRLGHKCRDRRVNCTRMSRGLCVYQAARMTCSLLGHASEYSVPPSLGLKREKPCRLVLNPRPRGEGVPHVDQHDKTHRVPLPRETTRPYSVARLSRSNIRQVSSETLVMDSSPSRSLRRNDVITQIT